MVYTDGVSVVETTADTFQNYKILSANIPEDMSARDMLLLMTNLLGLQILDEATTGWMLEDFGYEEI